MASPERPTSQRKLREIARAKLDQLEEPTAFAYTDNELLRGTLHAVTAASYRATPKTIREFTERLSRKAVIIGGLDYGYAAKLWQPFTVGSGRSTRRDAQLVDRTDEYKVLDIVSYGDTCCVTTEQLVQAEDKWKEGGVLLIDHEEPVNCPALLIPRRNIPTEWVGEALSRHFRQPVSPVELVA